MKKIIRFIKDIIDEKKWLKSKPCVACMNFDYYMGSAGICTAKSGCPTTRMKDCSECCDCGKFKRKRKAVCRNEISINKHTAEMVRTDCKR